MAFFFFLWWQISHARKFWTRQKHIFEVRLLNNPVKIMSQTQTWESASVCGSWSSLCVIIPWKAPGVKNEGFVGISTLSLESEVDKLSPTTVISTSLMPLDWWEYLFSFWLWQTGFWYDRANKYNLKVFKWGFLVSTLPMWHTMISLLESLQLEQKFPKIHLYVRSWSQQAHPVLVRNTSLTWDEG